MFDTGCAYNSLLSLGIGCDASSTAAIFPRRVPSSAPAEIASTHHSVRSLLTCRHKQVGLFQTERFWILRRQSDLFLDGLDPGFSVLSRGELNPSCIILLLLSA